jgi:hypothetical protein
MAFLAEIVTSQYPLNIFLHNSCSNMGRREEKRGQADFDREIASVDSMQ